MIHLDNFLQNKKNFMYFISLSVSQYITLLTVFFCKFLCSGFFYKEKGDLEKETKNPE